MNGALSLIKPLNGARASKSYRVDEQDSTLRSEPQEAVRCAASRHVASGDLGDLILCDDYPNAKHWLFKEVRFSDFDSYVAALEDADRGGYAVIHGERCAWLPRKVVNRRWRSDEDQSEPPCFQENPAGTSWLMVDIDDLANDWCGDECLAPGDEAAMRALTYAVVCETLPPEFHDAYYWFQWSNGMLIKKGWQNLKLHLWFMLDAPVTDTVLQQWAATVPTIDPCVYRTVQCNYVAAPSFDGVADPLGSWRTGAVREFGTHEAVRFSYQYVAPAVFRKRSDDLVRLQQELWRQEGKKFRFIDPDYVSAPMRKLAEIGVGGHCYQAILGSAASWVMCCGINPDYEAWKNEVLSRVAVSGSPRASTYENEKLLSGIWRTALKRYSPLNPMNPPVPRELIINDNEF